MNFVTPNCPRCGVAPLFTSGDLASCCNPCEVIAWDRTETVEAFWAGAQRIDPARPAYFTESAMAPHVPGLN